MLFFGISHVGVGGRGADRACLLTPGTSVPVNSIGLFPQGCALLSKFSKRFLFQRVNDCWDAKNQ